MSFIAKLHVVSLVCVLSVAGVELTAGGGIVKIIQITTWDMASFLQESRSTALNQQDRY